MESKTLYLFFFKKLGIIPDFLPRMVLEKSYRFFEIRIPVDFSEVSPEWNEYGNN